MSNHRKQAKLKASITDFIGPLLTRLKKAKEQVPKNSQKEEIIEKIIKEVENTQTYLDNKEVLDMKLTGYIGKIERQIDYWVDQNDITTVWNEHTIADLMVILNQLSQNQRENRNYGVRVSSENTSDLPQKETIADFRATSENASGLPQKETITEIRESLENASDLPQKEIITEVGESSERAYDLPLKEIITEVGESSKNASNLPEKEKITKLREFSSKCYEENIVSMTLKCIESLDPQMVRCLYSLGIFPENTELKKRLVIYWWIAMGFLPFSGDTSRTIEQGEFFFSYLVGKDVLTPVIVREHNHVIDSCFIKPIIHKHLISSCERDGYIISEKVEEGTWHLYKDNKFNMNVLLNLDQRYLNSKDISNKHDFPVVHLGSWHYTERENQNGVEGIGSVETKSIDHIEVDDTHFLEELGKKVTYLSLRGISRIEELHESIGKLEYLKILDLKACHNLDKLPQKPRSIFKPKLIRSSLPQGSWFKMLMVLDISECYLLDYMPKWVSELSNLEVLKGFVVGSVGNKNQSCQLGDLSKLSKLWKLSIRIATGTSFLEDSSGLKPLDNLLVLTIIWGGNKDNNKKLINSLPKNLEKLDIRCYPETEATELLNPEELKMLKRLYIRGGKLTKITNYERWEVEILRLKFLKNLKTNWVELRSSFKKLKYVEYVECPELENFPEGRSCWIKEKDEPNQSDSSGETSNQS